MLTRLRTHQASYLSASFTSTLSYSSSYFLSSPLIAARKSLGSVFVSETSQVSLDAESEARSKRSRKVAEREHSWDNDSGTETLSLRRG